MVASLGISVQVWSVRRTDIGHNEQRDDHCQDNKQGDLEDSLNHLEWKQDRFLQQTANSFCHVCSFLLVGRREFYWAQVI